MISNINQKLTSVLWGPIPFQRAVGGVGQSLRLARYLMMGAPCPIHTHITSITYIYKVIDIIYMWIVIIWLEPNIVPAYVLTLL